MDFSYTNGQWIAALTAAAKHNETK